MDDYQSKNYVGRKVVAFGAFVYTSSVWVLFPFIASSVCVLIPFIASFSWVL
jgi:hypothetical protein